MPERRSEKRPGAPDRRDFPRPPLWLNLVLLIIGIALAAGAVIHRQRLDARFEQLVAEKDGTPFEVTRIRSELAEMDLTKEALEKELDARVRLLQSLKTDDFYISLDTKGKRMRLMYGNDVVRNAPMETGPGGEFTIPGGKTHRFVPLLGSSHVVRKETGGTWQIPEWVYVRNNQPVPSSRPSIEGGLGQYVVYLPNGYVIHSPPSAESPLKGPKPGSFMVPAEDLKAIWPRITANMRVYVF